ncbi:MAG: EAL domain-containing protein [Sedimentibacter sp.]
MDKGILKIFKSSQENKKAYEDIATEYFNFTKFRLDLCNMINSNKYSSISLILLAFENMDMIKHYVDYDISNKSYIEFYKKAGEFFHKGNIYSIQGNKVAILLSGINIAEANNLTKNFIINTKKPIYIDNMPITLVIKGGIANYPSHDTDPNKLITMMDKALDQAIKMHSSTQIYNNIIDKEQEIYYRDLVSLYNALKNNMFTLAFQPIIDIQKNKIASVEALLRWNDKNNCYNSVTELIKRAEDAGFINEITKWLFSSVTEQLKTWKEKGIEVPVSMNLSLKDLADDDFIDDVKSYIEKNNLNPKYIEFELNEKSIIQDEKIASEQLKRLKSTGAKLYLDDYGAGYNSIKNLMDLAGKFDYLKIDKIFIDKILKNEKLIMVDCIIKAAHRLGMKVIAEGVEIQEQVEILKAVDCDMIQGFYYSKPLTAEELEKYIISFNG